MSFFEGGLAGSIYLFIGVWFGMITVIASIAEMASMAPTAGGQYHYVSELAPRNLQAFLSYLVAWFSCLGWVAGTSTHSPGPTNLPRQPSSSSTSMRPTLPDDPSQLS